jgi:OOP family OmpA-OmpF porin
MSPRSPIFLILSLFTISAANAGDDAGLPTSPLNKAGYLTNSDGIVIRGGNGECWRAGLWTPALATLVGCDGVLAKATAITSPAIATEVVPVITEAAVESPAEQATYAADTQTEAETEAEKISFDTDTLFDFDKAALKAEGRQRLDLLASRLMDKVVQVVVALGHTDSIGSQAYNQQLSEKRAKAVADYLNGKGIPSEKIFTEGRGASQPIASNSNEAGRAMNRRVEIEVVAVRAKE